MLCFVKKWNKRTDIYLDMSRIQQIMATKSSIQTLTESTNHELWKMETQVWTVVTELSDEKQALAVALKKDRWQRSGIDTIMYHTCPRIPNGKVTKTQLNITNESQEVSPFSAGDHKAAMNRHKSMTKTRHK